MFFSPFVCIPHVPLRWRMWQLDRNIVLVAQTWDYCRHELGYLYSCYLLRKSSIEGFTTVGRSTKPKKQLGLYSVHFLFAFVCCCELCSELILLLARLLLPPLSYRSSMDRICGYEGTSCWSPHQAPEACEEHQEHLYLSTCRSWWLLLASSHAIDLFPHAYFISCVYTFLSISGQFVTKNLRDWFLHQWWFAVLGKTTLADCLVASNGIISQKMAGKVRKPTYLTLKATDSIRAVVLLPSHMP